MVDRGWVSTSAVSIHRLSSFGLQTDQTLNFEGECCKWVTAFVPDARILIA
jgi:hypothetical protein